MVGSIDIAAAVGQNPRFSTYSQNPRFSTYSQNPRFSTYSMAPTLAPSVAPTHLSTAPSLTPSEKAEPLLSDIKHVHASLQRMEDARLESQRYAVSEEKTEEIGKLALGAKLERALDRRYSGQDATFTKGKKEGSPSA